MQIEKVILVDEQDREIGEMEKMEAHQTSSLHRAFSIFVFSPNGQMLLHRRADGKYHSGGLWTNTCCGHPRPGEKIENAASRRLQEEMGFQTPLNFVYKFQYQATVTNELEENEIDSVFFGVYQGEISPDPTEVSAYKWVDMDSLAIEIENKPEKFTPWFKIAMKQLQEQSLFESVN